MQITITGRHPGMTSHVKEYAEAKMARLERYFDGTHRIEVIMTREGEQSVVEVLISATRRQIVSESRSPDLYAAIDAVLDKAEKQLIRYKEKLREHRPKPGGTDREAEEEGQEEA